MIPYGRQTVDESDVAAVREVLRGDWLTQGPHVEQFEEALRQYTGARFVVAFSSGTAALHGAAVAAGWDSRSIVFTSPLSFVASANAARYVGAQVRFWDIDGATLNLEVESVPECDGLIPVHYGGLPADLTRLKHRPGVIIEDATHALGALTPQGPVGSCALSDMCVFSFHPVKAITTGEGGAVTTNQQEYAEELRIFRNHGIVRKSNGADWRYQVSSLGFNYRLSDIHAALGTSQLKKIEAFIRRRNELAERYRETLRHLPLELPSAASTGFRHAYHLFPIGVEDRERVFRRLRERGVGVQVHYVPIYHHPRFKEGCGAHEVCPHTEEAYARLLSLPIYPSLTEAQQDEVVEALASTL